MPDQQQQSIPVDSTALGAERAVRAQAAMKEAGLADAALCHGVQRVVEVAIAIAVESIPGGHLTAVGRDRCHPGEHRERRLGVDAAGVGPGAQHSRGHDRSDAELLELRVDAKCVDGDDQIALRRIEDALR